MGIPVSVMEIVPTDVALKLITVNPDLHAPPKLTMNEPIE